MNAATVSQLTPRPWIGRRRSLTLVSARFARQLRDNHDAMTHVIEVFVRDHCFACPPAYEAVMRFAASRPDVRVIRHDFEQARATVARYRLFATPAVVIDGRSVLYGIPRPDQLAARCDRLY